jgi:hypothetical protein
MQRIEILKYGIQRVENILDEYDKVSTRYIDVDNFTTNGLYMVNKGDGYDLYEYTNGVLVEKDYYYYCDVLDEDEKRLKKILDREEKINYFLK